MKRIFSFDHSSPAQLALLNILGSLLTIGAMLMLALFRAPAVPILPIAISSFVCLIAGCAISFIANSHLKNSILHGRWTEEELASLQTTAQWPLWTPLCLALCMFAFGFMIFGGHAYRGLGYAFLLPAQAISQLRQALFPRHPAAPGASILHSQLAPIHSEHWGER
jgi:hypothetical protein